LPGRNQHLVDRPAKFGRRAPPGALGSVDLAAQRKRTLDLFTTGSNDLGMGAKRLMPGLVLQFSGTYLQSGGWPLG